MKRFIISVLALALAAALLSCTEKVTETPKAPTVVEEPVAAAVRLYITRDGTSDNLAKLYILGDEDITCAYDSDDCEIANAGPGAVTVKPDIQPDRPEDWQKKHYVRAYFYRGEDVIGYAVCECGLTVLSSSIQSHYETYILYQHVFTEDELTRHGGADKEYADACIGRVIDQYEAGELFPHREVELHALASPPRAKEKSITFSTASGMVNCSLTVSGGEFEGGGTSAVVGYEGTERKSAVWYPGSDGGAVYMRVIYMRGDHIIGFALYTIEDLSAEKSFETYFPLVDGTYQDVTEEYVNGRLDGIVSALTDAKTEVTGE